MGGRIRNRWIDFAKGIAILCVIIGHTTNNFIIRGVIFSFHMPLFFICSGMTYRVSQNNEDFLKKLKKGFIALPLTATILFLVRNIALWLLPWTNYNISIADDLKTLLFSSGITFDSFVGNIRDIGMTWFFFVLFTARTIYDYACMKIGRKYASVVSIVLMIMGYILGKSFWLPFSTDIAMVVVIFIYSGEWYNRVFSIYKNIRISAAVGLVIVWALLFAATYFVGGTYLEFASRTYPAFPLCFITALVGTSAIFCISIIMQKTDKLFNIIEIVGRNSLLMFEIHYLDDAWGPLWNVFDKTLLKGQIGNTVLRMTIDIVIFVAIYIIRNKYSMLKLSKIKENS